MNPKPSPLPWLLSGLLIGAALLTGILWWRAGSNPFLTNASPEKIPATAATAPTASPKRPLPVPAPALPSNPALP
ncbi:MAG: hypothetical protein JWL81_317, partial [Verrucomicrobiales bacterium]|nr:hypothetical protein [Verrucomicrobiales bacterium]